MKKSTKNTHSYHFRKRSLLELLGLSILIGITYLQWGTIKIAIHEIQKSESGYIWMAVALYWILLPLTAISYRLLSDKRLIIWTTTLAQLAGSGPGRIVPGGLGRLSLCIIHLMKLGFSSAHSIIVTVTNNIIGIIVNLTVLAVILLFEPEVKSLFQINTVLSSALILLITILVGISLFHRLLHAKRTRKSTLKLTKKWRTQLKLICKNPVLMIKLFGIALLILTGGVVIILLCSRALGVNISMSDALIALSVGVFIGGVLPTPGGVGGVEAGIASTLMFLGYSPTEATSIAILFRAITYWQPLIPGTIAYFYLRKKKLL